MTYNIHSKTKLAETLNRMFSLHPKLIDFNLSRLEELMAKFSNPENKLSNVIHIAGTNGKGSTSSFLKEILEAQRFRDEVHHMQFVGDIYIGGGNIVHSPFSDSILWC